MLPRRFLSSRMRPQAAGHESLSSLSPEMPALHTEAFRYRLPLIVLPAAAPAHMAPVPPHLRTHPHPTRLPHPDRRHGCHSISVFLSIPPVRLPDLDSHPHGKGAGSGFQIRPGFSQPDARGGNPVQISLSGFLLPDFRPPSPSLRSCRFPSAAATAARLLGQRSRLSSEDAQSPSEASDLSLPAVFPPAFSPPASPYRWKDPVRTPQKLPLLPH